MLKLNFIPDEKVVILTDSLSLVSIETGLVHVECEECLDNIAATVMVTYIPGNAGIKYIEWPINTLDWQKPLVN